MTDGVWAREVAKLRAGLSPGMRLMLLELDENPAAGHALHTRTRHALARRGLVADLGRGLGWPPTPLGAEVVALLKAEIETEQGRQETYGPRPVFDPPPHPGPVEVNSSFDAGRVVLRNDHNAPPAQLSEAQVMLAAQVAQCLGEAVASAIRRASSAAEALAEALIEAGWTPPPTEQEKGEGG